MFMIAEELLLIALDDEKGRVDYSSIIELEFGLVGAILAELAMKGRLALENKKMVVVDDTPVGDEVIDRVFSQIKDSRKPRRPELWIQRLNKDEIRRKLLHGLVQKGVLIEKEKKVLWVFTGHLYPTEQEAPEQQIRKRIYECLHENITPDERMVILLSLLKACDLVQKIAPRKDKRSVEKRIKVLAEDEQYGKAVKDLLEAKKAADLAARVAAEDSYSDTDN